jgi:nitrogen permease regulator 3-like protein
MASLLDWDLGTQVYPTVRWLVHHRRAKLVDIVHPQLKTVFVLPSRFHASYVYFSLNHTVQAKQV